MNALLKLAERCEQAVRADRELDGAIAALCFGAEVQKVTIGPDHRREETVTIDRAGAAPTSRPVPHYTASLDAAMTLVPEGYDWIIGRTNGGLTIHAEVGGRGDEFQRFAATPALALCAAALRALAAAPHHPGSTIMTEEIK